MKNPVSDKKKNKRGHFYRVLRGGSCDNDPKYVQNSHRLDNPPLYRSDDIGFRIVRNQK